MADTHFTLAKKKKDDEYYTQYVDIERQMNVLKKRGYLKDKIIFMPCDDINLIPAKDKFSRKEERSSQFGVYFHHLFEVLGLKKIVATHYKEGAKSVEYLVYEGRGSSELDMDIYDCEGNYLDGDGDFRSPQVNELLENLKQEGDVVIITNPPFSLAKDFINGTSQSGCDFCIIGSLTGPRSSYFIPYAYSGKVYFGNNVSDFYYKDGSIKKVGAKWYTSFPLPLLELTPSRRYFEGDFPYFDRGTGDKVHLVPAGIKVEEVINIDKLCNIPFDYDGIMAVPFSILGTDFRKKYDLLCFSSDLKSNGLSKNCTGKYFIKKKVGLKNETN